MMRLRNLGTILCLVFSLVLMGCSSASPSQATTTATPSSKAKLQHIFYIMMENHGHDQIIGNTADASYLNQLATTYGVANKYYGVTHPSLPNYLAAISGDFQGIWDDCKAGADSKCKPEEFISGPPYNGQLLTQSQIDSATNKAHMFSGQTIVDQLEAHNMTWKAYMQSMPSAGYTDEYAPVNNGSVVKLYAQKHNPFVYFSNIRNNPTRMQQIVPFTQLDQDMQSQNMPNFVWISPDQCNDMHSISAASASAINNPDCASPPSGSGLDHKVIALGDKFVGNLVPQIMKSSAWKENSAIVLAWDENDYSGYSGCCGSPKGVNDTVLGGADAPIIIITSKGTHHVVDDTTQYNHYSLLATIEHEWGFDCLASACSIKDADLMTKFFEV